MPNIIDDIEGHERLAIEILKQAIRVASTKKADIKRRFTGEDPHKAMRFLLSDNAVLLASFAGISATKFLDKLENTKKKYFKIYGEK